MVEERREVILAEGYGLDAALCERRGEEGNVRGFGLADGGEVGDLVLVQPEGGEVCGGDEGERFAVEGFLEVLEGEGVVQNNGV